MDKITVRDNYVFAASLKRLSLHKEGAAVVQKSGKMQSETGGLGWPHLSPDCQESETMVSAQPGCPKSTKLTCLPEPN